MANADVQIRTFLQENLELCANHMYLVFYHMI